MHSLEGGDALAAIDTLLLLTSLSPEDAAAHRGLGRAWLALGQPEEATASLHHALKLASEDAETYFYLGCALQSLNRIEEATLYFQQAVKLQPDSAEARNNLGTALAILGRRDEALPHLRKALALRPNYPDARRNLDAALRMAGSTKGAASGRDQLLQSPDSLPPPTRALDKSPSASAAPTLKSPGAGASAKLFQRALRLQEQGRLNEAQDLYLELLTLAPDHADAHNNLGMIHFAQRRPQEAEILFRQAISLRPTTASYRFNLGNSLMLGRRYEEAVTEFQKALDIQPNYPDAWSNAANALFALGRYAEADTFLDRALDARPGFPEAWNIRGTLRMAQHKFEEAIGALSRALALKPDYSEAYANLGAALTKRSQLAEGEVALRKSLSLQPHFASALSNLGNNLYQQGRFKEAESCYRRAVALAPDSPEMRHNLSMTLLYQGDFTEGWQEYEFRTSVVRPRPSDRPRWNGEPLEGRTLLVSVEQGLGDALQFVRFLPLLKQQAGAGRILFECFPELARLLQTVSGCDELLLWNRTTPPETPHDSWIQLMSLPHLLHTDLNAIPAAIPYVRPNPDLVAAWRERLQADTRFKIGLVWAGNPTYSNDRQRSCRLADFAPLSELPHVSLYSLQKGDAARAQLAEDANAYSITDLADSLQDFSDTAAAVANLDLILTVDTSVAHLAGAMGRPVWTLLPFAPDWRWLHDREDSPWYPTMSLFRQSQPEDWTTVFRRVARTLTPLPSPA